MGNTAVLESSAVSRAAAAHLETERKLFVASDVGNNNAHVYLKNPPVFLLGLTGQGCLFWDNPCRFSSNSCRTSITLVGDTDLGLPCATAPPIRFLVHKNKQTNNVFSEWLVKFQH